MKLGVYRNWLLIQVVLNGANKDVFPEICSTVPTIVEFSEEIPYLSKTTTPCWKYCFTKKNNHRRFIRLKFYYIFTESAKLRALRAKNVLTCQHVLCAYMLPCQHALRDHVATCLACLSTNMPYVLTCSHAQVPTCFACLTYSRAHVSMCIPCALASVPWVLTCLPYLRTHLSTCLKSLASHGLRDHVFTPCLHSK